MLSYFLDMFRIVELSHLTFDFNSPDTILGKAIVFFPPQN